MINRRKTKNRSHSDSAVNGETDLNRITHHVLTEDFSSNMLYPKEDLNNRKLMFACRTCQFSEEASSSCVFRNNLYNTVGETAGVTQDVGSDPTVGFPECCTLCGQHIGCPFCQEVPVDTTWVYELLEDAMLIDELSEDNGEEEEEAIAQQPLHTEMRTQAA